MGNIDDGFEPREIRFNKEQIIWILKYLVLLIQGYWPPCGNALVRSGLQGRAYFETSIIIASEIEFRLKALGDDEFIIRDRFCPKQGADEGDDIWMLAKKYHQEEGEIRKRIKRGLAYMAGFSRKKISYKDFIKTGWHSKRRNQPKSATK